MGLFDGGEIFGGIFNDASVDIPSIDTGDLSFIPDASYDASSLAQDLFGTDLIAQTFAEEGITPGSPVIAASSAPSVSSTAPLGGLSLSSIFSGASTLLGGLFSKILPSSGGSSPQTTGQATPSPTSPLLGSLANSSSFKSMLPVLLIAGVALLFVYRKKL